VDAMDRLDDVPTAHGYPDRVDAAETKCLSYPRWRRGAVR
jgi:hypothetical protein